MVRNSSVDVTVVVLIDVPFSFMLVLVFDRFEVEGLALVCAAVEAVVVVVGVDTPLDGLEC